MSYNFDWTVDPEFDRLFNDGVINHNSLLKPRKSYNLYTEIQEIKGLPGNTAEVGVFQGRTSRLIHKILPNKKHYAYDTYCGIIGADASIDVHIDGEFSAGLELVKSVINMDNVVYKVGFFPDSFSEHDEQFCFVHSDTDTYVGTKSTLDYFCSRLVPGGKIVFDDYQWHKCPGVEKALIEFKENDNSFVHKEFINLGTINQYSITKKV
jgi:O-methyltransferase